MKKADEAIPNNKLKQERVERNWTQGQVAEKIGTSRVNVSRWEHGRVLPDMYFRQQLCELFGKNAYELGLLPEHASANGEQPVQSATNTQDEPSTVPETSSPLWHVPYRRNPFFTGREEVLQLLHDALHRCPMAALIQSAAISGLGGIGKTQTAIEYAYRYRDHYQAVFWLKADSSESLIADMLALAEWLDLPERQQQDQQRTVEAVKLWLNTHHDWLLLLDNVEDPTALHDLLPSMPGGSILLTTRSQVIGTLAERVGLEQMEPEEGALFLLRRTRLVARVAHLEEIPQTVRNAAQELSRLLGGLPLALDQAGAYVEETGCGLEHYLNCYQTRQATLLNRRGAGGVDHPMSVATTFSLALEQVEHIDPAAADLLRLSAFLHPDAIPEEIISTGAVEPGSPFQSLANDLVALDAAITTLRRFSLVRRNAEAKTLTVHRLVQAVVKDSMDEERQRCWAERAVRILNAAFPDLDSDEVEAWTRRQQYLPQIYACTILIEKWKIASVEAGLLLYKAGRYLGERADYSQAEVFLKKARDIRGQVLEPDHPHMAQSLVALAEIYYLQSRYAQREPLSKYQQAEHLCRQALALQEKRLGTDHPDVADSLNHLAMFYVSQGKYAQAESLFESALAIYQKTLGLENCRVATELSNLGKLAMLQGHYAQAEPFLQQAVTTYEKIRELESPAMAVSLNHLAVLYTFQEKYAQAETLLHRTLAIYEQTLGPEHPRVAETCNNLAKLYATQNKCDQATHYEARARQLRDGKTLEQATLSAPQKQAETFPQ